MVTFWTEPFLTFKIFLKTTFVKKKGSQKLFWITIKKLNIFKNVPEKKFLAISKSF